MKKKIDIDQLKVGIYMEADVRDAAKGAVPSSSRNVLLLGKGMLIISANQIRRLKEAGLNEVTIDTTKGDDVEGGGGRVEAPAVIIPQERRKKALPKGREVPYKDKIKVARKTKAAVTGALKNVTKSVAMGGSMDSELLGKAGKLLTQSIFRNVDAMVGLTRIKEHDAYTATHCINVSVLVLAVAHTEGADQETCEMLAKATLLHDIGKTKVPLEILNKPGRFEPHELAEMRKHTQYSEEILRDMPGVTDEILFIASQHHEMLDGSGYPNKLKGEEIARYGNLTAIADVYDALTSARVYKPALPPYYALGRIYGNKEKEFRSDLVDLFVKSLGLFPVGSLVELNTEEIGIVTEPNPESPRKPKIGIMMTRYKKWRQVPLVIDLEEGNEDRRIVKVLDPTKFEIDIDRMLKAATG